VVNNPFKKKNLLLVGVVLRGVAGIPLRGYLKVMLGDGFNDLIYVYPPVNKHSNGKSPFSIRNTSSKGLFSIAMLV